MVGETLTRRVFRSSLCSSCTRRLLNRSATPRFRPFHSTVRKLQDEPSQLPTKPSSLAESLNQAWGDSAPTQEPVQRQGPAPSVTDTLMRELQGLIKFDGPARFSAQLSNRGTQPHYLHVYSHKHNTHMTLTRANHDSVLSLSCGNLGFKKANRGGYDAGFQLAAYFLRSMQDRGLLRRGYDESSLESVDKLRLIFRGFGQGREAVTKALLGNEGRNLRDRIVQVTDATRLKFGGTRSPRPKRR